MKIAIDAMGGDKAPKVVIEGVSQILGESHCGSIKEIFLVGQADSIIPLLKDYQIYNHPKLKIVHADEVVYMNEPSITPLRSKKKSSISICLDLVKNQEVDAVISAGHTGACVASSVVKLRTLSGIHRPAIATVMPNMKGFTLLIDAGANIDSKPEDLIQFAQMGEVYSREILGVENPTIGLLSIGVEDTKGNELTKETFERFKELSLNFIGNVEGNDLFKGKVDVLVCDGFIGNVLLKSSESLSRYLFKIIKDSITKTLIRKIAAFFLKPAFKELAKITEYDEYGGAPLLGVNGSVIICHGGSSPKAIKNAIKVAVDFVEQKINNKIVQQINVK